MSVSNRWQQCLQAGSIVPSRPSAYCHQLKVQWADKLIRDSFSANEQRILLRVQKGGPGRYISRLSSPRQKIRVKQSRMPTHYISCLVPLRPCANLTLPSIVLAPFAPCGIESTGVEGGAGAGAVFKKNSPVNLRCTFRSVLGKALSKARLFCSALFPLLTFSWRFSRPPVFFSLAAKRDLEWLGFYYCAMSIIGLWV